MGRRFSFFLFYLFLVLKAFAQTPELRNVSHCPHQIVNQGGIDWNLNQVFNKARSKIDHKMLSI